MSSNVGLSTPRGSGTSGYVQKNHAFLRPRGGAPYPPPSSLSKDKDRDDFGPNSSFKQRQPDKAILEHEMKRDIEVKVLEERERLEEENERIEDGKAEEGDKYRNDEEIEAICEEVRKRLVEEMERNTGSRGGRGNGKGTGRDGGKRGFKAHQVHEAAEAKIVESERLRRALGIRDEGDRVGPAFGAKDGSARGEIERRREKEREREREREREERD
ncbi:hypothetical protein BDV06DRAFT_231501 [Aspergillus oleicola]